MYLPLAWTSGTRRSGKEQLTMLNRPCPGTYDGRNSQSHGVERITLLRWIIRVSWLWWWHLRWEVISSPRCSWTGVAVSIYCIMKPFGVWDSGIRIFGLQIRFSMAQYQASLHTLWAR